MKYLWIFMIIIFTGCGVKPTIIPIDAKTVLACNMGKGTLMNNTGHYVSDTSFYAALSVTCIITDNTH